MFRFVFASSILFSLSLVSACQTSSSGLGGLSETDEEAMFTSTKNRTGEIVEVSGQFGRDWTFEAARGRVREVCQEDGLTYGDDFKAEQINAREIMSYAATCVPVGYVAPEA